MTRPHPDPEFVTLTGMASMLGVCPKTARRIARDRRLPMFVWGGIQRVRMDDVRALAECPADRKPAEVAPR